MIARQTVIRIVRQARAARLIGAPALAIALALGTFQPAAAAGTITVTTTTDEYDLVANANCSLREAITSANTDADFGGCARTGSAPYTISVPAGNYFEDIDGAGEDANATGDLDLTAGMIISGAGEGSTFIYGADNDRVIDVTGGPVTLGGVNITSGTGDPGSGIRNTGTLILDAVTVTGNSGSLYGAGIYNAGTLDVLNGSAIGGSNIANDRGGGIYNTSTGTTTVDASVVNNNWANEGGAIYNEGVLDVLNGSVIGGSGEYNLALVLNGGGIYNAATGVVTVDASTVSANLVANNGGGIYNFGGAVTVQSDSAIGWAGGNNSADVSGGGIYNTAGGLVTVDASTVSNNVANVGNGGGNGGGIYNSSTLIVLNSSAIDANAVGGNVAHGGGIYNNGTATVDASAVGDNSAANGAGIYNDSSGILTVKAGSVIGGSGAGNTATVSGGGIYNLHKATVDASTVSANTAPSGAGIYNASGALTVKAGSVIGGSGAGNVAATSGGGVYNLDTTTVDASTIQANTAAYGGGIYNTGSGSVTVTASKLLGNSATGNGDAAFNNVNLTYALSVSGSCIVGNGPIAVRNTQAAWQWARGNWWGDTDGPGPVGPSNYGDTISSTVLYGGFLTAPILDCGYNPAPSVSLTPSLDFGSQMVGTTSDALSATLTNTGTALLQVNSLSISGSNSADFAKVSGGDCPAMPFTLTVSANCTINFTFSPSASGARSATATLSDDASGDPHTVLLSGTGTVAAPAVDLDLSSLDFGSQMSGTTSAPQTVTLTNTGAADLHVGSLTKSGTDAAQFALSADACSGQTVVPSATCAFDVTFGPTSTGAKGAQVNIPSDASTSPDTVSLSGMGTTPPPTELLINGDMELDANVDKIPDNWKKSTSINTNNDKQDCLTVAHGGSCSFTIKGNGTSKKLTQSKSFSVALAKGTPFTFSVWVQTSGVPGSGPFAQVKLTYTDSTTKVVKLTIPAGTVDWAFFTTSFSATKKVKSVMVTLTYNQASGFIWFDDVSLTTP